MSKELTLLVLPLVGGALAIAFGFIVANLFSPLRTVESHKHKRTDDDTDEDGHSLTSGIPSSIAMTFPMKHLRTDDERERVAKFEQARIFARVTQKMRHHVPSVKKPG